MAYDFDGYYRENEIEGYNDYDDTETGWFYQDPYYLASQNAGQNMLQEMQFDDSYYAQRGRGNDNPMGGMPRTAPPSRVPSKNAATFRVDSGSIRHCIGRFTYIWQDNGMEYWMFPVNVSATTVTGFRWNGRRGWAFSGVSLRRIDSFTCV